MYLKYITQQNNNNDNKLLIYLKHKHLHLSSMFCSLTFEEIKKYNYDVTAFNNDLV